jgi:hypothetical protein
MNLTSVLAIALVGIIVVTSLASLVRLLRERRAKK